VHEPQRSRDPRAAKVDCCRNRNAEVIAKAHATTLEHGTLPFIMAGQRGASEPVSFHRNSGVDGIEARFFGDSAHPWSFYSTDFEFLAPESWSGEVCHRGTTGPLEPGALLCARPGEVFAARKVWLAGSRSSLSIDERSLAEYLSEHGADAANLELVSRAEMSPALNASLSQVFRAFRAECSALEIQARLVEFFARAVPELFGRDSRARSRHAGAGAAEKIRERLDADQSETVDLATLAREVGLSRFATLRAFKRQFGLPPHAYRLRVRLGLARKSLRDGLKPAEVAAEYGFVDQSHLTRHFRRLFGITPAEYARLGQA
jgi:AraC-like DNA-binding protein